MSRFRKAEKKGILARVAIAGPPGSGKTWTALEIARVLAGNKRVVLIDTENSSSERYADVFDFDKDDLTDHSPASYVSALRDVSPSEYGAVVVDSLSHAWVGKGGALEMVTEAARHVRGNSYVAWRDVTPEHNKLVDALLTMPVHLIVTMRSKMDYVLEDDGSGKKVPKKVGMAPIQREGLEYEMDIVLDMDVSNNAIISKTRFHGLPRLVQKPGKQFGELLLEALGDATVEDNWKMTREDMQALLATGKSKDEISALSGKMFGKTVPELNREEYKQLHNQLIGVMN